jgi:hypothetical protein
VTTIYLTQDDYIRVAKGLVQMGATSSSVDYEKLGMELQLVAKKLSMITPDIIISTATAPDGNLILS